MEHPSLRHYTQVSKIAPHLSLMKRWIPLFGLFITCVRGGDVDVQDIVRRAASAMQADWAAAPGFAFVQRDVTTSKENDHSQDPPGLHDLGFRLLHADRHRR